MEGREGHSWSATVVQHLPTPNVKDLFVHPHTLSVGRTTPVQWGVLQRGKNSVHLNDMWECVEKVSSSKKLSEDSGRKPAVSYDRWINIYELICDQLKHTDCTLFKNMTSACCDSLYENHMTDQLMIEFSGSWLLRLAGSYPSNRSDNYFPSQSQQRMTPQLHISEAGSK